MLFDKFWFFTNYTLHILIKALFFRFLALFFGFVLSVFFLHSKQYNNIVLQIDQKIWWIVKFLNCWFLLSYSHILLPHYLSKKNSSWLIFESIKALEIKTSMLFNLSCFFFFFLMELRNHIRKLFLCYF